MGRPRKGGGRESGEEEQDRPPIRMERPPRGSVPELGIVFAPWTPIMRIAYTRGAVGMLATVAVSLLIDWALADPGPWPNVAIPVGTVLVGLWIFHGARPHIRRMREERDRDRPGRLG